MMMMVMVMVVVLVVGGGGGCTERVTRQILSSGDGTFLYLPSQSGGICTDVIMSESTSPVGDLASARKTCYCENGGMGLGQ